MFPFKSLHKKLADGPNKLSLIANSTLAFIVKGFGFTYRKLLQLYRVLVTPGVPCMVLVPYLKKLIATGDSIQYNTIQFTRLIAGMRWLELQEELDSLDLHSLEFRRYIGDLTET